MILRVCWKLRTGLKQLAVNLRWKKTPHDDIFSHCRCQARGQSGDHNRPSPCCMGVYSLSILILFFPPFLYFLQSDHIHHMFSVSFHPPIPWMETTMPILQMKRLRHSYWELELRFAGVTCPPKPFASSPPYITSPPHLFSSFLASTPGAIA